MTTDAGVGQVLKQLYAPEDVEAKTRELARSAGTRGYVGPGVPAVCYELASESCGKPLDKNLQATCMKVSGVSARAYKSLLREIESELNLSRPLSISELTVRFGVEAIEKRAEQIVQRYIKQLHTSHRDFYDCSRPVFAAAAITVACKERSQCKNKDAKIKLDVKSLKKVCGYDNKELQKIVVLFERSEKEWPAFEISHPQSTSSSNSAASSKKRQHLESESDSQSNKKKVKHLSKNMTNTDIRLTMPYVKWRALFVKS